MAVSDIQPVSIVQRGKEYAVEEATCEHEVTALLRELSEAGLVEIK